MEEWRGHAEPLTLPACAPDISWAGWGHILTSLLEEKTLWENYVSRDQMSLGIVWPNFKISECFFETDLLSLVSAGDAVTYREARF